MKFNYFNVMIKPASSACNMNCEYCFYKDVAKHREIYNYGTMSEDTIENIIKKVFSATSDKATITFNFQGGEPLLAGHKYFDFFINKVEKYKSNQKINYNLQTNLTMLDEWYIDFFRNNKFLLGVSLDGFKENNDKFRKLGKNSNFDIVMTNIERLNKASIDYNIITVLTSELSKNPKLLYKFYKKYGFKHIQIIPCLDPIGKDSKYGLSPENFYLFYKELSNIWLDDNMSIDILLFTDIIGLLYRQLPLQCGMLGKCSNDFIIEADGSVYPCDFYSFDRYKLGNINKDNLIEIYNSDIACNFINERKILSKECDNCKYYNICVGNCKRMARNLYTENYCGYKNFLEYFLQRLKKCVSK